MPKAAEVHIVGSTRVYKRGRWWNVSYSHPELGRQRESLRVTTLSEATAKAKAISGLLESGQHEVLGVQRERRHETFSEFVNVFRDDYGKWSESTWRSCKPMLRLLEEDFGERQLAKISVQDIESWHRGLTDRGYKPSSAARYLNTLKTVMSAARRWQHIAVNPAQEVRPPRLQQKLPNPYTTEEAAALIEAMAHLPEKQRILIVLLDTGMRKSEAQKLTWGDVEINDVKGRLIVRDPKNKVDRVVPMRERVLSIFRELRPENAKQKDYVWKSSSVDMIQILRRAGVRVGIEGATLHRCRDTFCTRLADTPRPAMPSLRKPYRHWMTHNRHRSTRQSGDDGSAVVPFVVLLLR
jgi:site-specific recombinase XerD